MVRPKAQRVQEEPWPAEPQPESPPAATEPEPSTTGWLRRSLNLGKKPEGVSPAEPVATPDPEATVQMSLFDIEQAEAVAEKKKPKRAPAGVRFVLACSDGTQITLGDRQGILGVKPVVEGEELFRVYVDDPSDTVAPEHLEFGVDKGVFWVQDLKTVNGTVVEEPGSTPIQCIPYEKYFVVRGSTISVGSFSFTLN